AEVSDLAGEKGELTAKAAGTTDITATLYGLTATFQIEVSAATVQWLELSVPGTQVAKNTQAQLRATAAMSDGSRVDLTPSAVWYVDDATVGDVAAGALSAKIPGVVTVTAVVENFGTSAQITVSDANLTAIALNPLPSALIIGSAVTEVVTASFDDGTSQDVTAFAQLQSSDVNVATVSSFAGTEGVIAAVGQGSAVISASYNGLSTSTAVNVAP
ncbi:MAG: hypothetical protein ACJ790_18385, partial [Myxococcaceae bacterium]